MDRYHDNLSKRKRSRFDNDLAADELDDDDLDEDPDDLEGTLASLEGLLSTIGGGSKNPLEQNIDDLATLILKPDLSSSKQQIIKSLCNCIISHPHKLTIYSTIVGLINAKRYKFGADFIEIIVRQLKEELKACRFNNAKTLVRLLGDLVNTNVLTGPSILKVLENLMDVVTERDVPQARKDTYVYICLAALPWVGMQLDTNERCRQDFGDFLQQIHAYIQQRQKIYLPLLMIWNSDEQGNQEEYLDSLWMQIVHLRQNKWSENVITRPYVHFKERLSKALSHEIPHFLPPAHRANESHYPLPSIVVHLFDYADLPEGHVIPGSQTIDRYLIDDLCRDIICSFSKERELCAKELVQIRPDDQKIPWTFSIVEVIFSMMMQLPSAQHPLVFYGSLIIELFRADNQSFPTVVMQATQMLYDRLDSMNLACIERFADWFSFHLCNHMFRWTWNEWADCLESDPEAPKAKFVREVLEKCRRLYNYDRIVTSIPEDFVPLLPPKPDAYYKFRKPKMLPVADEPTSVDPDGSADSSNQHDRQMMQGESNETVRSFAQKVWRSLKEKPTPEEILSILETIPNPAVVRTKKEEIVDDVMDEDEAADRLDFETGDDKTDDVDVDEKKDEKKPFGVEFNPLTIEIMTCSLLYLKRESLSHSYYALVKYKWALQRLCHTELAQCVLLNAVYSVWANNSKFLVFLVEKLLHEEIVESTAVIEWIFSEPIRSNDLTKFYVWEMVDSAVTRQNEYVSNLQQEIEEQRELFQAASRKMHDGNKVDMRKVPSLEEIERREEHLRMAINRQQNLFVRIFKKLHQLMSDHLAQSVRSGRDPQTPRFKWLLERLQLILMRYNDTVSQFLPTLEAEVFTADVETNILQAFQQFSALRL